MGEKAPNLHTEATMVRSSHKILIITLAAAAAAAVALILRRRSPS